jgi:hypothetical protein
MKNLKNGSRPLRTEKNVARTGTAAAFSYFGAVPVAWVTGVILGGPPRGLIFSHEMGLL